MVPPWFGSKYPKLDDLEDHAIKLGAPVQYGDFVAPGCLWDYSGPVVIFIPAYKSDLARAWALAHELGHLCQHSGPRGTFLYGKDERQADQWAACALIPAARVRRYRNASVDAFIGALSRHYEEILPIDCETRRLAARIAQARLWAMANEPTVHASGDSWG